MIKPEEIEIHLKQIAYNAKVLHGIEAIPITERIPIMDGLKAQTKFLATQEEQFRLVMGQFREATVQGLSPDPSQLMEQVSLIYRNLI